MLAASDHGVKPVAYYEGLADRLHEAAIRVSIMGKPQVIGSSVGLVLIKALVVRDRHRIFFRTSVDLDLRGRLIFAKLVSFAKNTDIDCDRVDSFRSIGKEYNDVLSAY